MPNWWMELDWNKNVFVNVSEKSISGILAYVLQSNATQKETFKTLYMLASTHAYRGGGLPYAFVKTEANLKNIP